MTEAGTFHVEKRIPLFIVLLSGAFITILNQTLLGTALPPIMKDLQVSESTVQWLQSIFMLVNGIMIPITAFLIERFTSRQLFLTAMIIFAAGTLLCAVGPEFTTLLIGRVLQAAGAGIMMPLMQTILFLLFPVEKRGTAMGLFGLVIAFAPAIGPTLSGVLVEHLSWRSVFYVVLPIAIIIIITSYFLLKNVTETTHPKLDIASVILSTLGFGGLLYSFSSVGEAGWASIQFLLPLIIGIIALVIFIRRQLKLKEPMLEFRVFNYGIYTLGTVLSMFVFGVLIATNIILPLYMQNMLQFSALESGLVLLPGAILMGIMNPVTGYLFDRFGGKWLARLGLIVLVGSTIPFTLLTAHTSFTYLAIGNALRMLSISMVMMPMTTLAINQLPNNLIAHGTAMNNTFRQMAGAIGTAVFVTLMSVTAIPKSGITGIIHGVNVTFTVAAAISVVALLLSFKLTDKTKPTRRTI
ncbi:DHA2 family efflux MFS transporter permease subunit [Staphylococcus gallinarum]|uniref:MFS transporter n=1 Tax=Staphylococcus gallinarum TaxID=1293 RepID=A0A0D0SJU0_STAGA|nr:MDR family MFS transporter [Staphylococcus gallinarum]KIR12655.1 multidrug MFS transporter [Staphylococcus gallinarum]MCD8820742.1 DHA2 family efflux MFS transporter permease subunit [Staphylococcus gallinarum]MCD8899491.1 DHA2 family efflux MFS transporter permease subunit [Staphylococcus gallinarum]MCD8909325.1 DHA2 family efflux MFS transporter permease subunit [Staphylococcus gallinarum]MCD8919844.1 DHA2 family efflux MFS transporter permease subunit [Staphylococcus gallinarum]